MSYQSGERDEDGQPAGLPQYQLADVLGRGAFGVVYRALNWTTGETVAVKQIGLSNIPKSELPEIMSEIELLKKLDHPNIVQYRGSKRTKDHLFIILEFCENGSLHTINKKFGKFPEHLVAQYICQVLDGLLYLHDQGVIHRDLKASNILATKEGGIKLADFGVATRAGLLKDSAVVGSPYWMAPEVIDQSGATTASDIWSVGAVVVELLDGKPMYSFLEPMLALFRIVNDDCPPIPEGTSPVARDFLLQCFQKDCNLRISARKLLKHSWMVSARKRMDQTKRDQNSPRVVSNAQPVSAYDETVHKVQEWNKALEYSSAKPSRPLAKPSRPSEEVANVLQQRTVRLQPAVQEVCKDTVKAAPRPRQSSQPVAQLPVSVIKQPSPPHEKASNEEDDNWDQDFEDDIPANKIAALDRDSSEKYDSFGTDDNSRTLRPVRQPAARKVSSETKPMQAIEEDYSDIVVDDKHFKGRVASLRSANSGSKRILHPRDLSNTGSVHSLNAMSGEKTIRVPLPSSSSMPNFAAARQSSPAPSRPHSPFGKVSPPATSALSRSALPSLPSSASISSIDKYSEVNEDTEDFSDLIGKDPAGHTSNVSFPPALKLSGKLSGRSWLGDDDSDEDDPFAEEDFSAADDGDAEIMARDKLARISTFTQKLIEALGAEDTGDFTLNELCVQLIGYFDEEEEAKKVFVREHGMLAIIEALQTRRSREVIESMLRIINLVVEDDGETLEKICLIGACPVIVGFAANKYPRDLRLEAALFIGSVCRTSLLTLQMFISCRGLKTLVEMMDENYEEQRDLIWMAVEGLCRVFEMQGTTPRTDFCRMLAAEGLLTPLADALIASAEDGDELAESAKAKICSIFLIFAQSDLKVKEALATRPVVTRLVKALDLLDGELLISTLKAIKNTSMSPKSLSTLQNADVIQALVRILKDHIRSTLSTEIANPIVNTLYNLCRLSKSRQEEAASSGAIPVLMDLVQSNSPLKQFALPLLCDFAQSSRTCRKLLWHHDGLAFYLGLLMDPFWSASALESIQAWLSDDTARVEDALLQPFAIEAVIKAFNRSKATTFENLLDPLLKILRTSGGLCLHLAGQEAFLSRLVDRLSSHAKAVVRLNLLRITKVLYESTTLSARDRIARTPKLINTIRQLADGDPAILVRELAKELSREIGQASSIRRSSAAQPGMKRSNSTNTGMGNLSQRGFARLGNEVISRARSPVGEQRAPVQLKRSTTNNNLGIPKQRL